ncbi:MAG: twin-arginine translocase subunit TatC, partial [Ferruginibacter sp.]
MEKSVDNNLFKKFRKKFNRNDNEMSFIDHLEQLRWHLVRSVIAWLIGSILTFIFIDYIFDNVVLAP